MDVFTGNRRTQSPYATLATAEIIHYSISIGVGWIILIAADFNNVGRTTIPCWVSACRIRLGLVAKPIVVYTDFSSVAVCLIDRQQMNRIIFYEKRPILK